MLEVIKLEHENGEQGDHLAEWSFGHSTRRVEVHTGDKVLRYEHASTQVDGVRVFRFMDSSPRAK